MNLSAEIIGDEDEATHWKELYGSHESTLLEDEDESEHDIEVSEVEVRIIFIRIAVFLFLWNLLSYSLQPH